MKQIKMLVVIFFLLSITACAKWGSDEDDQGPFKDMSAQQLYTESKQALAKEEYESAIKRLEALETMYPFNDYAEQAELDLIYAYYKKGDYPSAAATAERFIHLYPRAKRVDYAYYMKGLANFQQTRGTLANIFPIDESWRDPGTQSQAFSDFATLIQKFPDSQYKANALQRMIYLRNLFAQRELNIANYYYIRQMYVAAAERANYLIKTYPQAPSAKPALSLVYHANMALGLKKAADDAMRVYQATYHSNPEEIKNSA
ncbi:outer membrane protein assembly factor BamD [Legionella oakridgensis]|uniref:Outer membrane protein assembly factor BamD n=2 Tax=Legionella oakridgensis TaxID=29423 RepID=W0B8X9_9GAMM|nr:outer membrane protein assembly factor BamD [Legionella oakridgensis]AHE66998.1 outer membrane assembly lipoprotein YfiO [Legionella oakridgensis ATCC 33761 = DSM 21215]ETO93356.1 beta-barrel assembly machine, subunit BamD [Legionella oakridgensis RV-2-2007]KTD38350.1 competence lipoprotein ComL [Legionella oakridgensis]STY20097.1 competence lipoprotein ComL [Legionella longbeachae]